MENPYQSPSTPPLTNSPNANIVASGKLFSPGNVAWASFLGMPIAGCILLAINYRRLGSSSTAAWALFFGLFATVAVFAISFSMETPSSMVVLVSIIAMYLTAKSLQERQFKRYLAAGGVKASDWAATSIGLLCLACLVALAFAAGMVMRRVHIPQDDEQAMPAPTSAPRRARW